MKGGEVAKDVDEVEVVEFGGGIATSGGWVDAGAFVGEAGVLPFP